MAQSLPADLFAAEAMALAAVLSALSNQSVGRWSVTMKFEGLRLMPVAIRMTQALGENSLKPLLVWPDAGAAALARRDAPELALDIRSIRDQLNSDHADDNNRLLLVAGPQMSDYDEFADLCEKHAGSVVMLNGRLEDAAVGIGSVARARRRGFMSSWQQAYWLEPLAGGALMRAYPEEWMLFRADADGYRYAAGFEERPDAEAIDAGFGVDPGSLAQQLGSVERFLDGLSN